MNNTWHHYDENSDTVVVFVHGYFSDSAHCWKSDLCYWPDLLVTDTRIPRTSIYLGGYYTGLNSGSYSAADCAAELVAALQRVDAIGRKPAISSTSMIFICHSLGGIVVREMITSFSDIFREKKIGLVLIASPSLGSDYATNLRAVASFYKNRVGKQLAFANSYLEDLDNRFARYLNSRPADEFVGAEALELHSPFLMSWLRDFKPIVSAASAGRYFSHRRKIRANHSSIAKPTDINHPSHEFVVDFFQHVFKETQCSPLQTESLSTRARSQKPTDALFDSYEYGLEPHYVQRQFDQIIANLGQLQSVWISAPSGTGKTCALKRYAITKADKCVDICLSQCISKPNREAIIREILETLVQLRLHTDNPSDSYSFQSLASCLVNISKTFQSLIILIDEVPSEPAIASAELLSLLSDLLAAVKQRSGASNLTLLVSSLLPPIPKTNTNLAKLGEQMAFLNVKGWSNTELHQLYDRVTQTLPELSIHSEDLATLVAACDGSPRFMKTYFRIGYARQSLRQQNIELIRLVRNQLGLEHVS